ncbi:MAG: hypothetical protein Fur009_7430 [Candidatus Microgenomates bacterium]
MLSYTYLKNIKLSLKTIWLIIFCFINQIPKIYKEDVLNFIEKYIVAGSIIYTDFHPLYKGIDKIFSLIHKYDVHKKFEFHLTSEIEGLFGVLRTFIRRMYHHVSYQKLPEYLHEFQNRFLCKKYFKSVYSFLLNTLKLLTSR